MKPAILWEPVDTQLLFDKTIIPVVPLFLEEDEYEDLLLSGGDTQSLVRAYFNRSKIAVCQFPDTLEVIIFIVRKRHDKKAILRQALTLYENYIEFEADTPLSRVGGLIRVVVNSAMELVPVPASVFHSKSRNLQISTGMSDYDRQIYEVVARPDYAMYTASSLRHPGVRSSLETKLRIDLRMVCNIISFITAIVIVGRRVHISLGIAQIDDEGDGFD